MGPHVRRRNEFLASQLGRIDAPCARNLTKNMRVLIATATAGGGHLAAAAALDEAWRAFRPQDVVDKLDVVKFFSPLHRKIHADGYLKIVEHAPELWGMMFGKSDRPDVARKLSRLKRVFPSKSRLKFIRYVQEFAPDVVLCTHYLPVETMGLMRPKAGKSASRPSDAVPPLVVSIVTDFEAHALWMDPCVGLYCVAAEETKARLVARGASSQDIVATGIPIAARFSRRVDEKAVRKKLGLRDDLKTVLVLSGGFGTGPIAAIVTELDKVSGEFQTVVVTGHNDELRSELAVQDREHPTRVLGFASNMDELIGIGDLIISKPGGLTTSEVLAMGKPLFIVSPIPGQEAANSDFLLERGAAAKVNRVEDLPFRVESLLGSKKLGDMARAAKVLGKPDAARRVCEETLQRARNAAAVTAAS